MTNIEFKETNNDPLHTGMIILIVLFPLIGLILYFVHKKDAPNKSKGACYAALGGMVLGMFLNAIAAGMS
jgi:hypothetical protein